MLPELTQPIKPCLRIYYGPYKANGIIKHREQKLKGLKDCLEKQFYVIDLIPIASLDELTIEVFGTNAYKGVIKYLKFNMECEDDEACQYIVCKVKEFLHRLYNQTEPVQEISNIKSSVVHKEYPTVFIRNPKIEVNYFRRTC